MAWRPRGVGPAPKPCPRTPARQVLGPAARSRLSGPGQHLRMHRNCAGGWRQGDVAVGLIIQLVRVEQSDLRIAGLVRAATGGAAAHVILACIVLPPGGSRRCRIERPSVDPAEHIQVPRRPGHPHAGGGCLWQRPVGKVGQGCRSDLIPTGCARYVYTSCRFRRHADLACSTGSPHRATHVRGHGNRTRRPGVALGMLRTPVLTPSPVRQTQELRAGPNKCDRTRRRPPGACPVTRVSCPVNRCAWRPCKGMDTCGRGSGSPCRLPRPVARDVAGECAVGCVAQGVWGAATRLRRTCGPLGSLRPTGGPAPWV